MAQRRIGIIGYGEVGRIFAQALLPLPDVASVGVWDVTFAPPGLDTPARAQAEALAHAREAGVTAHPGMAALCAASDLVISAVTASQTLGVAQEAARHIGRGAVFLDLNSASPGTKQRAAQAVEEAGAFYVEAGVMTSVPPYGIRVPMLLGGAQAARLAEQLNAWGMDTRAVSESIGTASAIKMCRSVMVKGLEALVIESYSAALAYGVHEHMLPTLQETFPGIDWEAHGAYFFSRVAQHGQRRAEEMREAARTVQEAGFEPLMARAIADKHQWVAEQARGGAFSRIDAAQNPGWQDYAQALLAVRPRPQG